MHFLITHFLLASQKFFTKLSGLCGTLVVLLVPPDVLEQLTCQFYRKKQMVDFLGDPRFIERGLFEPEKVFVEEFLPGKETCLVLHCGTGREVVALARMGFHATGIDQSEPLIRQAQRYANEKGIRCRYLVRDALTLSLGEFFDAIFLGADMYSAIPLKERRIAFLRRVEQHLKENGFFYLEFTSGVSPTELRSYPVKRFLARLFGNRWYDVGDRFTCYYYHVFATEEDLLREIEASALKAIRLNFEEGWGVLKKG